MNSKIKLGVVGSRSFNNFDLLESELNKYLETVWCIVSGGARGADLLAEKWADKNRIKKDIYYPEWDKYGKKAGMIRNELIISESDMVIAFWDGKSKGTLSSINLANKANKEIKIITFDE